MPHLEGLHHVTAITGDAPRNVDFYVRLLGLRMVKKTVNFDQPDVYHLYYGDEQATAGSLLTFFEYPGARPGRAGAGMVHTVQYRVASAAALEFWAARLQREGVAAEHLGDRLRLADPEGLVSELVVAEVPDRPLAGEAPDIPAEHAILGFHGVRAYAARPDAGAPLLEALGFERAGEAWELRGVARGATLAYDAPPAERGIPGGGTVHHVAWSAADDPELDAWRAVVARAGGQPTPIIDRQYFHSVYFREPGGVLFELATDPPGFAIDEPVEHLGERLMLPPQYERYRAQLEAVLPPIHLPV
ncbi:MAG TPA: ring-cleaving dioxygenase, partial [Baekduia sp.]|nr:ring-cleaving dioxygenase [Baekduia sp.]